MSDIRHYIDLVRDLLEKSGVAIPDGMVRRFHVTDPKNIDSIRRFGLSSRYAKGSLSVYSWPSYEQAESYTDGSKAIVEFFHDPANYENHPYATYKRVPPENII